MLRNNTWENVQRINQPCGNYGIRAEIMVRAEMGAEIIV